MALNRNGSPVLEEFFRTGQWIQDNRGELVSPQTAGFWPNSNHTAVDGTPVRAGCSRAPQNDGSLVSKDTEAILENMTYITPNIVWRPVEQKPRTSRRFTLLHCVRRTN